MGRPENHVKNRFYSHIKKYYVSEEDLVQSYTKKKVKKEED